MENQCQHLTMTQRNELLKLLQKFEEFFYGTLDTWKTDPVGLELKDDTNPICPRPYLVPKLYEEMIINEVEYLFLLGFFVVANYS